jgi:transposase InsO family protein
MPKKMSTKEQESGLKKFEIIAPLLSDGLEAAQKRRLRNEIMDKHGIAERTLRRYLKQYKGGGYDALVKANRSDKGQSKAVRAEVLAAAIELRRELPTRSTRRIITILESEGISSEGELNQSTLNRHLAEAGASRDDLKAGTPTRRFQKEGRNALWQADIKYGPYVPGKSGKKVQTYLMAILDDATRMPIHAEFYDNQKLPILEDSFRKGLLKFGVPEAIYIDNGKIFISKWFRLACARLGIRHIATKPYSPQSKGKIERFNGTVNEFLEELSLKPAASCAELNKQFRIWLEEGYIHKTHAGLEGKTPYLAYQENSKKIRFTSNEECRQVFLWEETRRVDRTGAAKLKGFAYDIGIALIRKTVDLRFDPFDLSIIEVWHNGIFIKKAEKLTFPEFLGQAPSCTPEHASVNSSRLLDAYGNKHALREKQKNAAISFIDMEEDDSHV